MAEAEDVHEMTLPKLSNSTVEATVTEWLHQPGDEVSEGDELVTVETDKVVTTLEAPVSGRLLEQCVAEDEELEVGDVLARIAL